MNTKAGLQAVQAQMRELRAQSGRKGKGSKWDLKYRAMLGTLVRMKRRERVSPSKNTTWMNYDETDEERFPEGRGAKIDRERPPAFPYSCNDHCETCFSGYFPVRISVTDEEAVAGIKSMTESTNSDLAFLRGVLQTSADLIVARWKKKSKTKGTDLLSSLAQPSEKSDGIMTKHKPGAVNLYNKKWAAIHLINLHSHDLARDMDSDVYKDILSKSLYAEGDPRAPLLLNIVLKSLQHYATEDGFASYRTSWMLPYLDVESLSEDPLLFLSLLHYRTAYAPEDWMMFDNFHLKLAENWEALVPEFNSHCVTMQGANYGSELVDWDQERCHHWNIVGYQKAQYILAVQQEMMNFLKRTVLALLDTDGQFTTPLCKSNDATCDSIRSDHKTFVDSTVSDDANDGSDCKTRAEKNPSSKWDQLIKNQFFSFGSSSVQSIATCGKQAFSAPPQFDLLKTLDLVALMYRESVDELDLIQTDPAYLRHLVAELGATAYFERVDSESKWSWFVDEIVCNVYRRFIWWRQMFRECQMALQAYERYQQTPSTDAREQYEHALFAIHDISTEHLVNQFLLIDYSLPFQRGFERNYEWGQHTRANGSKQPTIKDSDAFEKDKLFWCLQSLGFDEYRLFNMDPSFHFRVRDDYLSNANFKERSRISEQLLRSLSEAAVVDEIRTNLECDRNWTRHPVNWKFHATRMDFVNQYQKKLCLPEVITPNVSTALRSLCQDYAWPKGKRDGAWLERASSSREQLKRFWSLFRAGLKKHQQEKDFSRSFIDEDWLALSAAERPEHIQAVQEETQFFLQKLQMLSISSTKKDNGSPLPQPAFAIADTPSKFVPSTIREKAKTRKSQATSSDDTPPSETEVTPSQSPPRSSISVKPENLTLFDAMFPTSTYNKDQTRSFSWKHFLQAMADAGCSITHRNGSAVSFKNDQGVILFHQPHPEPTIDPVVLMSMGKRLRKWFGWSRDVFATKQLGEIATGE